MEEQAVPKIKEVKRMTGTMRIIHWANAICMVVAVVTGLYIGYPYYQSFIADPAVDKYVMAWNRWGHFIAAIIFDVTASCVFTPKTMCNPPCKSSPNAIFLPLSVCNSEGIENTIPKIVHIINITSL